MEDYGVAKGYIELDISSLESNARSAVKYLDDLERAGALAESELNKLQSQSTKTGNVFKQAGEKTKELSLQIEQAQKKCSLYESEIQALNTIIEQNKKKQSEWADKIKASESSLARSEKKLEDLTEAYNAARKEIQAAAKEYGENSTQVQELTAKYEKLIRSYENAVKAVDRNRSALAQQRNEQDAFGVEIEQSTEKITEFQTRLNNTQAAINRMTTELTQAQSKAIQYGEAFQSAGDKMQTVGDKIDGVGNALSVGVTTPVLAAGTAIGKMAIDSENSLALLQGQLGLTAEESEKLQEVARGVYENGYGDSLDSCIADLAVLRQNVRESSDWTSEMTQNTLQQIETITSLFDTNADEVTRTAQVMKSSGLISDISEGLDLITYGFQNGANYSGEMLDTLREYSPQFVKLGMDGNDAMQYLIQGAENGAFNLDKVGDALKELSIRVVDGSDTTKQGFEAMGLSADEMAQKFAAGGDSAKQAFQETLDGLAGIEDPVQRNIAGVNLFGTMWEDLGETVILSLADVEGGLEGVEGATDRAAEGLNNTFSARATSLFREFQGSLLPLGETLLDLGEEALPVVEDGVEKLTDFLDDLDEKTAQNIIKAAGFAAALGPGVKIVGTLTNGVGGLTKGFGGLMKVMGKHSAASKAAKAMSGAGEAAKTASTSTGLLSKALGAITSPAGLAITAITVLAGGMLAAEAAEKERIQTLGELTGKEKELADSIHEQYEAYTEMKENRADSLADINAEAAQTRGLADELRSIVDENGRIKEGYEDRASVIVGELSSALGQEISITDGVIDNYQELSASIEDTIQKQKALAVADAMSEDYTEALRNRKTAEEEYNAALETQEGWKNKIADAEDKLAALQKEYGNGANLSMAEMKEYNEEHKKLNDELEVAQEKYKNASTAVNEAREAWEGYGETIQNYEGLTAAIASGDAEQINAALLKIEEGFLTAETATRESLEKQRTTIREEYEGMAEDLKNGVPGVTQEAVDQMKALADQADAELLAKIDQDKQAMIAKFQECGMEAPQSLINAMQGKDAETQAAILDMLDGMSEGTALKKDELKNMLNSLGIEASDGLISSLKGKKADVQLEAIDLLTQLQTAESAKRGEILAQLQELGISVDDSLAEGINSNKDGVTQAGSSVGEEGKEAMQSALSGTNLSPPGINGITGTTWAIGTAGNTQMGLGLRVQNLSPPGVNDINSVSNGLGVSGNMQMGQGLKIKNLDPPAVNNLDVSGKASAARSEMQGYFDNNPLSVVVNVVQNAVGAVKNALGFAYGGIATEPSIFGEDGPEMAIPLSPGKRERAKALYAQTGQLLGLTNTEVEVRREALNSVAGASRISGSIDSGNIVVNMPGIDYDLLAGKVAAQLGAVLKSHPIQPIIQMKDGDVIMDSERVGRKVAPVVSRVQAQNM